MKQENPPQRLLASAMAVLLIACTGTSALAATEFIISSRQSPTGAVNADQNTNTYELLYTEDIAGGNTTAKSGAAGTPTREGARYFSNIFSNSTPDSGILLQPALPVAGEVYRVETTFNASGGNISTNIIIGVTNVYGCTLSWTNTTRFQRSFGNSSWQVLGYLTNNAGEANPRIRFYYVTGLVSAALDNRLLIDCFKFTLARPCLGVATVGINGPLSANRTNVLVTGVTAGATRLTVYQDTGSGMQAIGSKTSGIVTGNNTVTVTPLVKGAKVAATQTISGLEGCVPETGTLVGTGPNPSLRLAFSIRSDPNMTGPVGTVGTTGGTNYFIGSAAVIPNSGGCPDDALVVYPSNTWQTITLQRGPDPANPVSPVVLWNNPGGDVPLTLEGEFGALDGIAVACEGDPGDFEIYIDDLANGTNGVFESFEAGAVGTEYGFSRPGYSGTTSGNLLGYPNETPNSAAIVTNTAFAGSKCERIRWQFSDDSRTRWARLITSGNTGTANPEVQLSEPISFKLLLLRPGDPLPPPPAPVRPGSLSITQDGPNIILNWTGSYPLQSSPNVTGTYSDVGVSTGPCTNAIGTGAQFYRLRSN